MKSFKFLNLNFSKQNLFFNYNYHKFCSNISEFKANYTNLLNNNVKNKIKFNIKNHSVAYNNVNIILTKSDDITNNIALESMIFESNSIFEPTLFLWRNNKNVVIGRFQNPFKECNLDEMKINNVKLARRRSGGGAVYQDLGNYNFSFFLPLDNESKIKDFKFLNSEILSNFFIECNLNATFSGRNDVEIDNKKISGSAFRIVSGSTKKKPMSLHHGTLLYDVNVDMLTKSLNVNKLKLISKGVDSVKSRITNLKSIVPNIDIIKIFMNEYKSFYNCENNSSLYIYDESNIDETNKLFEKFRIKKEDYDKEVSVLNSWDWLYGCSPIFSNSLEYKFNWGLIDLSLNVESGIINSFDLHSDCLDTDFITNIKEIMSNLNTKSYKYDNNDVKLYLEKVNEEYYNRYNTKDERIRDMINILPSLV